MGTKINALCLVAHPDDCVIFAYSYIHNHPEMNWTIGYLTYTSESERGRELAQFWQQRNIPCVFLGFVDDYRDQEQQQLLQWYGIDAVAECSSLARQYDLVLTHDSNGDYGHIHHRIVHDAVKHHPRLVTFAPPGQGVTYTVPAGTYNISELPMHGKIVQGFHRSEHRNSYKETT
jgi:LmbE family N-acetylglucosaminyl deacetylase